MTSDQRRNLLRLMKLDDDLAWVNERLAINIGEYNSSNSHIAQHRIRECEKMRDDFQRQHDELIILMSAMDNDKLHVGQSKL